MKRYIKSSLMDRHLSDEEAIRSLKFLRHDYCGEQDKEVLTIAIDALQNPSGTDIKTDMTTQEIISALEFMRDHTSVDNEYYYDRDALNIAIDAIKAKSR